QAKIQYAQTNGQQWIDVTRQINNKISEIGIQISARGAKEQAQAFKTQQEDILRDIKDRAEAATGDSSHPAADKLKVLRDAQASGSGVDTQAGLDKLQEEINQAVLAYKKEQTSELKKQEELYLKI